MSEQSRQVITQLIDRLQNVRRRINLTTLIYSSIIFLLATSLIFLTFTTVEAVAWLPTSFRDLLFWTFVVLSAGGIIWLIARPVLRYFDVIANPPEEDLARKLGKHFPEVEDRLLNALQLGNGKFTGQNTALIDQAIQTLTNEVKSVPFEEIATFTPAKKLSRWLLAPAGVILVALLTAPTAFFDAADRILSPGTDFLPPAPFALTASPGSIEVVRGANLNIEASAQGSVQPRSVTLEYHQVGETKTEIVRIAGDSSDVFSHQILNIRQNMRYRIVAGVILSPWYDISVVNRPETRRLQLSLRYPNYTRIPPRRLDVNVGDVTALPGTKVTAEIELNSDNILSANLQFDDNHQDSLFINGRTATGSFTVEKDAEYSVQLQNSAGVHNANPINYKVQTLTDEFPVISVVSPELSTDLNELQSVELAMQITDDYGFRRLRVYYRHAESRFGEVETTFKFFDLDVADKYILDQQIENRWDIRTTGIDLVPGDVIEYYFQVWDNDSVAGFKSTKSELLILKMPSLAEQYRELEENQDETQENMEEVMRDATDLEEQFQDLRDEIRRKQEGDWEDQRELENITEQQQNVEERINDLSQQMEEISNELQENSLANPETLEMYQELQEVMQEINDPELQEALRKLQEAMQQMNPQEMQEAIEEFEFNEDQYKKRLERAIELFKRLRVQQKLDELSNRLQEIADQQGEMQEKTEALQNESLKPDGEENGPEENTQNENSDQSDENSDENADENNGSNDTQNNDESDQTDEQNGDQNSQENSDENADQSSEETPTPDAESLAQEQNRAEQEMQSIEQGMQEAQEQMEALENMPSDAMEDLIDQAERQGICEQLNQNQEDLKKGELNKAQQSQQQMQQQLQQMSQQMQQMQQKMQGEQMEINMSAIRNALDDVLTLSQQQEDLREDVLQFTTDNPLLRSTARKQITISDGLSVVGDTLQAVSKRVPQMNRAIQEHTGNALHDMERVVSAMAERQSGQAAGHQKSSMTNLNELALLLSDLLDQMQNQMSGEGQGQPSMQQMIEQMQQMSGEQQQLNQQIQQMLNEQHGDRLSQSQEQRLQQMAAQQQAIKQQLEELSQNPAMNGQMLGDLNRIAQQMDQTIQDLERGQVTRSTTARQQQILTRMLDAQRSLQQRGKERKRESESGRNYDQESPADLPPAEQIKRLRRDLIRALESGYANDYEELIKRYFELLRQQAGTE